MEQSEADKVMEICKVPDKLWTVVRVKPRTEKLIRDHCQKWGIPVYLPLRRRVRRYQRRKVVTYLPMFPGYIFVQLKDTDWADLTYLDKVVWIASPAPCQEDQLIRELNDIQRLEQLTHKEEIIVQPEVKPGKPVYIRSGPLRGTEGIVEFRHKKTRVTVNVEMLGQSASVDLDVGEVEPDLSHSPSS